MHKSKAWVCKWYKTDKDGCLEDLKYKPRRENLLMYQIKSKKNKTRTNFSNTL